MPIFHEIVLWFTLKTSILTTSLIFSTTFPLHLPQMISYLQNNVILEFQVCKEVQIWHSLTILLWHCWSSCFCAQSVLQSVIPRILNYPPTTHWRIVRVACNERNCLLRGYFSSLSIFKYPSYDDNRVVRLSLKVAARHWKLEIIPNYV